MICFRFGNSAFTAGRHDPPIDKRLEGDGHMGGWEDAGAWGFAWAMLAAAAGIATAAAAAAIVYTRGERLDYERGYNALAWIRDTSA